MTDNSSSYTSLVSAVKTHLKAGDFQIAATLAEQALQQYPADQQFLYLGAVCARYDNDTPRAEEFLASLLQNYPDYGRAWQEKGHLYRETNPSQADSCYQKAVQYNPALIASWQQIEKLASSAENVATAKQNINYLQRIPKVLVTVLSLIHENQLSKAERFCRDFLKKQPTHTEGMRLLALIAERNHVLDDAEYLLESLLLKEPDNNWARFDFINVLHRRQKFQQAHEVAKQLVSALPKDFSALFTFANQKASLGDFTGALKIYQQLRKQSPDNPTVPLLEGHAFKTIGDTKQAIQSYLRAASLLPTLGDAYWSLANLKTFRFNDDLIKQMQQAVAASLQIEDKIHLHFALGKAYEDKQLFDRAFYHYEQGNGLKKKSRDFTIDFILEDMQSQKTFFTKRFICKHANSGHPARDPIFIVGLPRAGSTLIEQILASHSDIDGTLELPNIIAYVQELNGRKKKGQPGKYPGRIADLSAQELSQYGQRYIEETRVYREQGKFFLDKMPNNFRHIGFIKTILPNAKIIDARRSARSCCFSAWKQLFAEGQEFSYDFHDLIAYYKAYEDLMGHWQQCYPDSIITVQYEDMVANTEQQTERLLNFLKLPMEPSCLEFYKNQRAVRTASSEQVRQPIYKNSLEPWRPFEANLKRLLRSFPD
ncbi:MAG: tetratricopeptide repeat protein [Enterobacterales bacterium]|nr:tetratricopeptide repeat protein [Enterobacterales bacterium]